MSDVIDRPTLEQEKLYRRAGCGSSTAMCIRACIHAPISIRSWPSAGSSIF